MEKIKTYKGFNSDMTCRGYQFEVGKEYEQSGDIIPCENGFHACENPLDVLEFYSDIENKYCEVEQYGTVKTEEEKTISSKIKIGAEIGFVGLFKAGIEWIKSVTIKPIDNDSELTTDKDYAQIGSSGDDAQIGSSGDDAQIGSSGNSAKIGSSGDDAQIGSSGKNSVICCAGNNSIVKAKKGSWITLSKWKSVKGVYKPICVKTEYVDGDKIKEDTWYKLINGEFVEQHGNNG